MVAMNPSNPSRPSPRQLVLDAWRAFGSADRERVAAVFTDDAEWLAPWDNPAARRMGGVHQFVGRDALVDFITRLVPAVFVRDVVVDFTALHECGDVVVVEETMTATLAHGGHYRNDYCFVFELEGDRIRRVREYMDAPRGEYWFSTPRDPDGTERSGAPTPR